MYNFLLVSLSLQANAWRAI